MTENKDIKDVSAGLTGLIEKRTAIVMIFAVFLVAYLYCSVSILSGEEETSIGGYSENPAPTAFRIAVTDGAVSIFAPQKDTSEYILGHWEVNGEYFSDRSVVLFCPMKKFGMVKYTFIPDDPHGHQSSVYAVICRFAG